MYLLPKIFKTKLKSKVIVNQNLKNKINKLTTTSSYNIWLLLRNEVLLVKLQEPVDQCLLPLNWTYLLLYKTSIGLWSLSQSPSHRYIQWNDKFLTLNSCKSVWGIIHLLDWIIPHLPNYAIWRYCSPKFLRLWKDRITKYQI